MTRPKRARSISTTKTVVTKRQKVEPKRKTKRLKRLMRKRVTLPKFGFLPNKLSCRLKATSEPFTLDPGAGGIAVVQNLSFNKPFAGFNSRQPREWDEMIALYGKCYIIGAKITVTAIPLAATADVVGVKWGIYTVKFGDPTANYPTGLTWADISEDHRLMKGIRAVPHVYHPTTLNKSSMTKKWSAKKWSGISDYIDGATTPVLYSTVTDDPTSTHWAGCNVWIVNQTNTDSSAVTFNASIEYICVFTDRNAVGPSS